MKRFFVLFVAAGLIANMTGCSLNSSEKGEAETAGVSASAEESEINIDQDKGEESAESDDDKKNTKANGEVLTFDNPKYSNEVVKYSDYSKEFKKTNDVNEFLKYLNEEWYTDAGEVKAEIDESGKNISVRINVGELPVEIYSEIEELKEEKASRGRYGKRYEEFQNKYNFDKYKRLAVNMNCILSEAFKRSLKKSVNEDELSLNIIIEDNNGTTFYSSFDDSLNDINLTINPKDSIL